MKRGAAQIDNTKADGLRAVCDTPARLPDLCHHAEYRIYVNGQYVESVGNLGPNAQRALNHWTRSRCKQTVEARATRCTLPNCERLSERVLAGLRRAKREARSWGASA